MTPAPARGAVTEAEPVQLAPDHELPHVPTNRCTPRTQRKAQSAGETLAGRSFGRFRSRHGQKPFYGEVSDLRQIVGVDILDRATQ